MTQTPDTTSGIEAHVDETYLIDTLVDLLREDTAVPLGPETLMEPDHPKLVHFVQEVIRPKLREIGANRVIDLPKNQLAVELGAGTSDDCLLVMAYTPAQHHNWMNDPFSGKIAVPRGEIDEPCAYGQGASQGKAHLAALLAFVDAYVRSGETFDGRLYVVVNNEARSTHECTRALLPELDPQPDHGLLLYGAGNDVVVGNRGRVDVLVDVDGAVAHSSRPDEGRNAIEGVRRVLNRLDDLSFTETHPKLGGRQAVPYQVTFDPVAPHTLPGTASVRVDRRLLPGDDVSEAVAEIRNAVADVADYDVRVRGDVVMEPSLVDTDARVVTELQAAVEAEDGEPAPLTYWPSAYDAGGLTNEGIPTVMWGRPEANDDLLGDDYVTIRGVLEEAVVVGRLASAYLG